MEVGLAPGPRSYEEESKYPPPAYMEGQYYETNMSLPPNMQAAPLDYRDHLLKSENIAKYGCSGVTTHPHMYESPKLCRKSP